MYGDRENTQWFSQTLMTHKDKFYGTEGYLRVSISTNTQDYNSFNPPMLGINIQNNYPKSYNLNYHNASDLLQTLRLVKKQTNGNDSEIQRKYQKHMTLYVKFFVESNNNDSVVDIRLLTSETDFTKIIIPIGVFATLGKCINYYVENYFDICTKLLTQSIQSQSTKIIHQLPSLIKGISSQIVHQDIPLESRAPEPEPKKVAAAEVSISDLDEFIGGADMSNIKVPEIDEDKPKENALVQIDSLFVNHLLKNDLTNLEGMMNNHMMNVNPVSSFASEVQNKLGPEIKGDFTMMPGITEDDLKSIAYMSKVYCSISYLNHFHNNAPIPNSMPVFKFKPKNTVTPENIEIAYDLFLFNLYVRTVRSRLEGRMNDVVQNKALFHIQLRCFTDPFVFSFIDKNKDTNLESIILNRYRYYDSIGVFDKYKEAIAATNCPDIKDHDIASSVAEAIEKVVGKSPSIDALHATAVQNNNFRLASKNNFSLEQIVNEIIPLEVAEKLGKDIKSDTVLQEIKAKHPISDEILNFFIKGKKKVKVKKESTFKNNLDRVVNFYSDEVPQQHMEAFKVCIQKSGEDKFDLKSSEFPLDEFGDNIIKALYLWDPKDDPKVKTSYKYYQQKIEKELMEKDLILAKIKVEEPVAAESGDWDFLSE